MILVVGAGESVWWLDMTRYSWFCDGRDETSAGNCGGIAGECGVRLRDVLEAVDASDGLLWVEASISSGLPEECFLRIRAIFDVE